MILEKDKQWFRSKDGKHLLAGSPLTAFTVSDAGARILDAIETSTELGVGHEKLTSRLLATGAVHPQLSERVPASEITVVIPVFAKNPDDVARVDDLAASLAEFTVIIVDDCSPHHTSSSHARIVRHDINKGPAASRNTGLSQVKTQFVAFVDSDAHATTSDLQLLASALSDESVVLVAPRVSTTNTQSGITEYESLYSPLDLGRDAAVVRPLSRVSYVPATVLVAHTERLRNINGFDEELRLGEDVDLVWRIVKNGSTVRYFPSVECQHDARTSWVGFIKQRFSYGKSAAALDHRHPFAASPLRANLIMTLLAITVLSGYLYLALLLIPLVLTYFIVTLRSTRLSIRVRTDVTRIGCFSTLRLLALAVRRGWWPIFIVASFFSARATAMYTFAVFTPLMFGILRDKPRAIASYVGLRLLDDLAFGAGVWFGVILQRSPRCLLPVLTIRRSSQHQ